MTANFVAKSIERQHLKTARKYSLQVVDINMTLSTIHRQIEPQIDLKKYEAVTAFVNQYITHTNIWKIKFVCNLENPEVVLMQLFHLLYIIDMEPKNRFEAERALVEDQFDKFRGITLYSDTHIEERYEKMMLFINNYSIKK